MKLTPIVNFINVKRANFSYKRWFWQLFSSYMYVAETTFVRKKRAKNVDEIDTFWLKLLNTHYILNKNKSESIFHH